MSREQATLQIGEFAKRAQTNLRTLRYYEECGLIAPAARSPGGFRLYDESQLERIALIRRLQDLGLSLKEIQELLAGEPCALESCRGRALIQRVETALDRQAELVRSRIHELQASLGEIDRAKAKLQTCKTCEVELAPESCEVCVHDHLPLPAVIRALL